jgi:hypothetical protein
MNKQFDWLKFYIGCECEIKTITGEISTQAFNGLLYHVCIGGGQNLPVTIKPHLRPLTDMTEDEMKTIYKIVFKKDFPKSGTILWYPDKNTYSDPRHVLSSGVNRLGVENSGRIWADCDMQIWKYNQHEVTIYLLNQHFDLFDLIASGEAIDKTKL